MIGYLPGASVLHRAHPYTPLAAAGALLLAAFAVTTPGAVGIVLLAALVLAVLGGVLGHVARPAFVIALPTLTLLLVLHGYTSSGEYLDSYLNLRDEAAKRGMVLAFPNGTKAFDIVRWLPKCHTDFATYIHGTKCAAQFSGPHHEGTVNIYKNQRIARDNLAWSAPKEPVTPWQAEWDNLLESIRKNRPHNEAKRAALSNLADIMGRAAAWGMLWWAMRALP